MISQEINQGFAVYDKETALEEYGRRCQAMTLAEKSLSILIRQHPRQDASPAEAAVQRAKAYAQEGWEIVLSYLRK